MIHVQNLTKKFDNFVAVDDISFDVAKGEIFAFLGPNGAGKSTTIKMLIMNFLIMPIFFLSGALFPLEGLPPALSVITRINPLAYGVDGLRGALINQAHFGVGLDLIVLGIITAVVLGIGTYLFSKIEA